MGLNPKEFGLHSLRFGGATAATNAEVPDRMFKRHGRWLSENAKDGYIKDKHDHLTSPLSQWHGDWRSKVYRKLQDIFWSLHNLSEHNSVILFLGVNLVFSSQ